MKLSFTRLVLLLLPLSLLSCNGNENKLPSAKSNLTGEGEHVSKPTESHLSRLRLEEQLTAEIRDAVAVASDSMVEEAATVVAETRNAVRYLLTNKMAAANKSIETAIGKAEVVTHSKPGMSLVPLEVNITVQDLVADMDVLQSVRQDVTTLTEKGYLQDARRLLQDLSSELTITTSSLPLGTYPDALKEAGRLNKENKPVDAALLLSTALGTVVREDRIVPLPLIRAEAMLKQVDSLLNTGAGKEDEINLELDNADYQIRFAEALGYGKRDKEFEEFYAAIKSLKDEVKKQSSSARKSNSDLRSKLNAFKNRVSPKTRTKEK